MFHRAPGSIGASSFPSRVVPGMRMGGHMGHEQVTVRNLEVIEVDTEDNVLAVKGAVPGPNGGYRVGRGGKKERGKCRRGGFVPKKKWRPGTGGQSVCSPEPKRA